MTTYGPIDGELILRDGADGAETSTASETGVALPVRALGDCRAVFHVSAADAANEDESYTLSVQVDSAAAFDDDPVTVGSITVTGPGVYEVPLSGALIGQQDPDAAAIRCTATLGGTTPSITYGAHLTPA